MPNPRKAVTVRLSEPELEAVDAAAKALSMTRQGYLLARITQDQALEGATTVLKACDDVSFHRTGPKGGKGLTRDHELVTQVPDSLTMFRLCYPTLAGDPEELLHRSLDPEGVDNTA